jgi:hypothetical protein
MKKFILILVMMLSMSVYSFADDSNATKVDNIEKYEFKINHRRLACVLDMSGDQMEITENIIREFERDMFFASSMETEESRNKVVSSTVQKNIKFMGYVLNKEQYHKYLILLNLTLQNRGFDLDKINK